MLGTLSECQTDWIQIRIDVGPDQDPNCLQRLLVDDTIYLPYSANNVPFNPGYFFILLLSSADF